ncbi:MAG: DUF3160 domain-containing protein [Patescibacteria group bacterium]|nr:DUF3160 domain-containing protein [Patescibacteria group bacterium]
MLEENKNLKGQNFKDALNKSPLAAEGENRKFNLKNKFVFIPLILVLALVLSVSAYYSLKDGKTSEQKNGDTTEQSEQAGSGPWKFNLVKPVFAQIEEMVNKIKASVPSAKVAISELENFASFTKNDDIIFTDAQKGALEDSGFFLAKNNIIKDQSEYQHTDDFVDTYKILDGDGNIYKREPDDAVFITSDTALHLYHILVDRSFQKMEQDKFQPRLKKMTKALFEDSISKYNSAEDVKLKDSYKRLSAYYLIPLVVLDAGSTSGKTLKPEDFATYAQFMEAQDKALIAQTEGDLKFSLDQKKYGEIGLSDEIYTLVKSELELIQKAEGKGPSPLFTPLRPELENDYSQFKPRSHYTKNDILKSYFIAMMWYGRMGFTLTSPDLTRDALIMTGQINNLKAGDEDLGKMWSDMADVIEFFVGEVDDLTAYEYSGLIGEVYGDNITNESFTDEAKLTEFINRAKKELPAPRIVSEALAVYDDGGKRDELLAEIKQFRFMGQRFTPDAYIINNLTQGVGQPDPETGQMLPTMPTALMPMAVIEPTSQIVKKYLDEWINDPLRIKEQGRESDKIIAKVLARLKQEFSKYSAKVWTQNIYWSWLNCYKTLLAGYGEGYPYFMQTESWLKKNLGTALGSYTELKHDTLLYAKQSYAEMGAGGPEPGTIPPVVKGYVEPDLDFWNKIITLAEITQKGLKDRNVLPQEFEYKYDTFIETAKFFKKLAEQELLNQKISDDDFEELRTISSKLGTITEPVGMEQLTDKEKRAGIIADIHTDAVKKQILYEATGKPFIAFIAVKDANGARLTRGLVYNHYEFAGELKERLSDEDWQKKAYLGEGQLPAGDKWSAELIK